MHIQRDLITACFFFSLLRSSCLVLSRNELYSPRRDQTTAVKETSCLEELKIPEKAKNTDISIAV